MPVRMKERIAKQWIIFFVPFAAIYLQYNCYIWFQKDIAQVDTAHFTKFWLGFNIIHTIPWPTWSLDLSAIDTLLSSIATNIYSVEGSLGERHNWN